MKKQTFKDILIQYICPILTGSVVTNELVSDKISDIVTLLPGGVIMHVRPEKNSEYLFVLERPQPFSNDDKKILKEVIKEIISTYNKLDNNYQNLVAEYSTEIAICKYLMPHKYETTFKLLDAFGKWSIRTYEGKPVASTILIHGDNKQEICPEFPSIFEILKEDFSALISNSSDSVLEISANGALIGYKNISENVPNITFVPQKFIPIAHLSQNYITGLTLTSNGEILIFQKRKLLFSKRRGIWNYFNHEPILKLVAGSSKSTNEHARKAIYETILDVSFARTGGCLAFVRTTETRKIIESGVVKLQDVVNKKQGIKSQCLNTIIGNSKFQNLSRTLRKEILGIDGATIIDYEGNIIAIGAIIRIEAGSTGGGRLAATRSLSKHGTAIKISADGMVNGYKGNKNKVEEILSFG